MTERTGFPTTLRDMLLFGLAYYAGASLGVHQTITPEGIAILWPPNAILLAAFLMLPRRQWPWLALAAMTAEIIADLPAFPLWAAVAFGLVNLFEVTLAAWLIQRLVGRRFDFQTLRQGAAFLLAGPLLASASAAVFGALVYVFLGRADSSFPGLWRLWWFGDALGLLLLTPLIVTLWRWLERRERPAFSPRKMTEALLLAAAIIALGLTAFAQGRHETLTFHFTPILLLPLGILAALRFGLLGATLSVALIAAIAVAHLVRGSHPYADASPQYAVWMTQEFLAIVAVVAIGLAILLREINTQRAELYLRDRAMRASNDAIVIADARQPDEPILWVNQTFERMFGYELSEIEGRNCRFLQGSDRAQPVIAEIRRHIRNAEPGRFLIRNYHKDGHLIWTQLSIAPVRDAQGGVSHFVGVQHDLTHEKHIEAELRATQNALREQNLKLEERIHARTDQLQRANARLAQIAATDHLTGIPNRRHFEEAAERELERLAHDHQSAALIMFDLDHFKRINDRYGHETGDDVLRRIITPLRQSIRPRDLCGRVGGEEFLILLSNVDPQTAQAVAERLRAGIAALRIPNEDGEFGISASFGVCQWDGRADLARLRQQADQYLYQAKREGRDRVIAGSI